VNNDGYDDALVCGTRRLHLYVNQAGAGFVERAATYGLTYFYADIRLVDMDADSDLDIVGINLKNVHLLENSGGTYKAPKVLAFMGDDSGSDLAVGDADRDGRTDIFAQRSLVNANPDDFLLMNLGGSSFTRVAVPAVGGSGSDVQALTSNGRASFLVLNGREIAGPTQLIDVSPEGARRLVLEDALHARRRQGVVLLI